MPEFIQPFLDDPYLLSGLIFLISFVLEDLATGIAGAVAVHHMVAFENVYIALFLGIFIGDLGLYGLGRAARRFSFAKDLLKKKHVRLSRNWIGERFILTIIGARFVPGLRMPTYAAFGFFKLPFRVFFITSLISVGIWTGFVLGSIFAFDMTLGDKLGIWKWPGIVVLILIFILGPKIYILKKSPSLKQVADDMEEE